MRRLEHCVRTLYVQVGDSLYVGENAGGDHEGQHVHGYEQHGAHGEGYQQAL